MHVKQKQEDVVKHHVSVHADEDSTYLNLNGRRIYNLLKGSHGDKERPDIWHIINAIVGKDISQKMYSMNDTFARDCDKEAKQDSRKQFRAHPMVRSLSLDTIDLAGHGKMVSNEWLMARGRLAVLKCIHDAYDQPVSNFCLSWSNPIHRVRSQPDVQGADKHLATIKDPECSYVLEKTLTKLQPQWGHMSHHADEMPTIPSLRMQWNHVDLLSCKFVDKQMFKEDWNGDSSWLHCGHCNFCKPPPEGEASNPTQASVKR